MSIALITFHGPPDQGSNHAQGRHYLSVKFKDELQLPLRVMVNATGHKVHQSETPERTGLVVGNIAFVAAERMAVKEGLCAGCGSLVMARKERIEILVWKADGYLIICFACSYRIRLSGSCGCSEKGERECEGLRRQDRWVRRLKNPSQREK